MDTRVSHAAAELKQLGMLSCTGDEARAFLHAQLTNDVEGIPAARARYAGWCSARGRLLASFLVVPQVNGFLLQLSRDIAPDVAKRLGMFILRAKAKLADASDAWVQIGLWGPGAAARLAALGLPTPTDELAIVREGDAVLVQVAPQRYLVAVPAAQRARVLGATSDAGAQAWALEEIRAGRTLIVPATQDLFVPQMVNFERLGAVDFKKGCYPGQEIVARTQYRGVLKRRLVRARVAASSAPGNELFAADLPGQASGTVANAAALPEGGSELLAVVQISSLESSSAIRLGAPDGPQLELLPLPAAA
jgi:tRNA-modifying protein YgfZ